MSTASGYIKGGCTSCSGHIEFPAEALGAMIPCPHCGQQTALLDNLKAAGSVQLRVNLAEAAPPPPKPRPTPAPRGPEVVVPPPSAARPTPADQREATQPTLVTPPRPASSAPKPAAKPAPAAQPAAKPAAKVSRECPSCGLEVSVKAEACPGCGMVLKEQQAFPWKFVAMGAGALALILFLSGGVIFKKGQPAWLATLTAKIPGLGGKSGAATAEVKSEPKAEAPAGAPKAAEAKAAPTAEAKKGPEKRVVNLSGKFELLNQDIERTPGRSLVYVVGTVTNGTPKQAFSVRVTFDLFNRKGDPVGNATDYVQVIESGDGWNFRALILDTNAVTAKLAVLEKEKDTP